MSRATESLSVALADRYRIERELGQGGMATVYLAADLKHDRKVAIKVLKPELAAVLGAERFIVEIKTTAALQHPHILPLFDSGEADGFLYYVMPYIQGETIREKLNRETQFAIDDAVRIAREVADALDYAHRHGVIHRDIKPENILLHDGRAMVMDFGIALAVSAAAGGRMTETGLSLGTPHYMSPEQATAEREITARSDIYSLASVLYEMLAGDPPFTASSAQAVIMKIITERPAPVTTLRKTVPPNVAAAVERALEKLPADRFENAKAFADALGNAAFATTVAGRSSVTDGRRAVPIGMFATSLVVVALAAAGAGWAWQRTPVTAAASSYRVTLSRVANPGRIWAHMAIAADGGTIVFSQTANDGRHELWIKTPDRADAELVAGAEGGEAPALSPDGQSIAFVVAGRLRKVARNGGNAVTLSEAAAPREAAVAWRDDGTLLFSGRDFALMSVHQDGGAARVVVSRDSLHDPVVSIASVAGSRTTLVLTCSTNCIRSRLLAVDLESGAVTDLATPATRVWTLAGGLVAWVTTDGKILVAPFDPKSRTFRSAPVPMLEDVERAGNADPHIVVAANGTVLFVPAPVRLPLEPVWVTRDGQMTFADSGRRFLSTNGVVALSPDARRLAVEVDAANSRSIWVEDFAAHSFTQVTFEGSGALGGWADGGLTVLYGTRPSSNQSYLLLRRRTDGAVSSDTLLRGNRDFHSAILLRDTTRLLVRLGPPVSRDISVALRGPAGAASELVPLLANDTYQEVSMSLSPDERWIAYSSNESGRYEVYVRPFPNVNTGRWQISQDGGGAPRWAHSGHELFYLASSKDIGLPGNQVSLVSASVTTTLGFAVANHQTLFKIPDGSLRNPVEHQFDVAPDDRRFLFLRSVRSGNEAPAGNAILIPNWLAQATNRLSGRR